MKQILIFCLSTFLLSVNLQAQGKFGIGLIYGQNFYQTNLENEAAPDIMIDAESRARFGGQLIYSPNDFLFFRSGVELSRIGYTVNMPNSFSTDSYSLSYLHIPLIMSLEMPLQDVLGFDVFIGPEYGLGVNLLRQETKNGDAEDTGFTTNLGLRAGSNLGLRNRNTKIYLNPVVQYTINPIVDSNVFGNQRALYFIAEFHVEYFFNQ